MNENPFDTEVKDMAWCPGCGNLSILAAVKQALAELHLSPREVVMVSGIGQAAKLPHYLTSHFFNGLHGRALPPATAIKAVNPGLTVIAESGTATCTVRAATISSMPSGEIPILPTLSTTTWYTALQRDRLPHQPERLSDARAGSRRGE